MVTQTVFNITFASKYGSATIQRKADNARHAALLGIAGRRYKQVDESTYVFTKRNSVESFKVTMTVDDYR
jgi:hypothetical protein